MAKTLADLNRRLDKLQRDMLSDRHNVELAHALGKMAKQSVHDVGGSASLGGDWKFSGWQKSDLSVAYSLHGEGRGVTIHRGRAAGPWAVAERGRAAGMSRAVKGGRKRRHKDGTYSTSVARSSRRVGATPGKGSWTAFERAVIPKVDPLVARHVRTALARAVTG